MAEVTSVAAAIDVGFAGLDDGRSRVVWDSVGNDPEESGRLKLRPALTDPLGKRDELSSEIGEPGSVVGRFEGRRVLGSVSVGEDNSSVHVSSSEVTDKVLDSDGPVVAYVRLGTYEPVLLGLPSPVPTVPLDPGLVS